jgi:hypothetical protein
VHADQVVHRYSKVTRKLISSVQSCQELISLLINYYSKRLVSSKYCALVYCTVRSPFKINEIIKSQMIILVSMI